MSLNAEYFTKQPIKKHIAIIFQVMNMDDIIPFHELNPPASLNQQDSRKSKYLVGPNRDQLKLNIVIAPSR